MRLKQNHYPPVGRANPGRAQGRFDFCRMMTVIVDDRDPGFLALELKPAIGAAQAHFKVAFETPFRRRHPLERQGRNVAGVVSEVRNAFLKAAIIGLAAALLLGLGFATTLLRRLERLRRTAQRVTLDGAGAPS